MTERIEKLTTPSPRSELGRREVTGFPPSRMLAMEGRGLQPSSVRFAVEPRDVPPMKAARRLHMTLVDFQAALPRLAARGFPRPDPDTGNFDLKAIDAWMDRRSGLASASDAGDAAEGFSDRLGTIRGGKGRGR